VEKVKAEAKAEEDSGAEAEADVEDAMEDVDAVDVEEDGEEAEADFWMEIECFEAALILPTSTITTGAAWLRWF
jgi:hypothetical protein